MREQEDAMHAYRITLICLGQTYHWHGVYTSDWAAIDAAMERFPQADEVIPRRITCRRIAARVPA